MSRSYTKNAKRRILMALSTPGQLKKYAEALMECCKEELKTVDCIAAVETLGTPLASAMTVLLEREVPLIVLGKGKPRLYPESYTSVPYLHGQTKKDESMFVLTSSVKKGWKVLLIDDTLSTGAQLLAAAKLLQQCEAKLVAAAFLIAGTTHSENPAVKALLKKVKVRHPPTDRVSIPTHPDETRGGPFPQMVHLPTEAG